MENKETSINEHWANMKRSFWNVFTPDRVKNDLFEGRERGTYNVFNSKEETYEMELTTQDEFTIMSFKMNFDFRGFEIICVDVAVGGLDASSGYPLAGKCYINMEYDIAPLELTDCIFRDFY